ncbi:MAG: sulfite exporter TauE/SafE family protein, partial [Gallionella sp.]
FAALISARGLSLVFAVFVYFAAAQILFDIRPHAARALPKFTGMSVMGVFTGALSSLVSIGGGTLVIPFLLWCNVPLRHAIGTSSAIGFPVALGGSIGYIVIALHIDNLPAPHLGYVYLPALFWVALASVGCASLGARASQHLNLSVLRKLFALLLLGLASKMLMKAWS